MATYAIGDVQGCHAALQRLLERVAFDPRVDRLWFAGDLVNRGPRSAAVLRQVRSLGDRAVTVLGNHDLHLLAASVGARPLRPKDTFDDVLRADDRDELLDWLRHRPLLHHDPRLGFTMVHAAIPPQWDLASALACARELETCLRSPRYEAFLQRMYGDEPRRWSASCTGFERLRYITNALTRLRYCELDGDLALEPTGPPEEVPHLVPWYAFAGRATRCARIVFGHWSTLRAPADLGAVHGVHHLDEGCVWGGCLCAMRLEDRRYFRVSCT